MYPIVATSGALALAIAFNWFRWRRAPLIEGALMGFTLALGAASSTLPAYGPRAVQMACFATLAFGLARVAISVGRHALPMTAYAASGLIAPHAFVAPEALLPSIIKLVGLGCLLAAASVRAPRLALVATLGWLFLGALSTAG